MTRRKAIAMPYAHILCAGTRPYRFEDIRYCSTCLLHHGPYTQDRKGGEKNNVYLTQQIIAYGGVHWGESKGQENKINKK